MKETIIEIITTYLPMIAVLIGNIIVNRLQSSAFSNQIDTVKTEVKHVETIKTDKTNELVSRQNQEIIEQNYKIIEQNAKLIEYMSLGRDVDDSKN